MQTYTRQDVANHASPSDGWIVIDAEVYDISKFYDLHPGGANVLAQYLGGKEDATEAFFGLHRSKVLKKYKRLKIGSIKGEKPEYVLPEIGELSKVPFAEPAWLTKGYKSPYFDESHYRLQKEVRRFFDEHVADEAQANELTHKRPTESLVRLMGQDGINLNAMRMGPGKHLYGRKLPGGVKPEQFTYFHELVVVQELCRIGAPGYMAGLQSGMVIGCPPLLNDAFTSDELRKEVVPDILDGKKFIALAISEAFVGSDVRGMRTVAEKQSDGSYIVTGQKKWITGGNFADWFMTGVRTSKDGLTMMLIPRTDDVDTKIIKSSYSSAAGTALVTFDKVRVPAKYVMGKENEGLKVILANFIHERWVICARMARYSRFIYEECIKWASLRKAFGKPLTEQPVIRAKLAAMYSKVEAGQAWLEQITYQMCNMTYKEHSEHLAGPVAALKWFLSRSATEIADDAVQIFGGRGITVGGMGVFIEQFQRTFKFDAVLGGSEEVLLDLQARQALKKMPKAAL